MSTKNAAGQDVPSIDWLGMTFNEQVDFVRQSCVGDVWKSVKSGRECEIIYKKFRVIGLKHESGRKTEIQEHYFAGDYMPNTAIQAEERSDDSLE